MKTVFCAVCICFIFSYRIPRVFSESILQEVKSFLDSANSVVEDVSVGLKSISAGVQYFDDLVKSVGSEDCYFSCPNGRKPFPRLEYKPKPGGCGAYGITLSVKSTPEKEFTHCCNDHDICYGTCSSTKVQCDEKFQKCLFKACSKQAKKGSNKHHPVDCVTIAKLFHVGTQALGCKAFKDAQAEACMCHDNEL